MSKRGKLYTVIKNSNNASKYDFEYSSGGRVYQVRDEAHPLKPRADVIAHNAYNEQMSIKDLVEIENLFESKHVNYGLLKDKDLKTLRTRIIEEYDLHLINNNRYVGDSEFVWARLIEKYPAAAKYETFTKLLYRARYGESKVLARYKASTGELIE